MAWSQSPRLLNPLSWPSRLDPFRELNRIQAEVNKLFGPLARAFTEPEFPPVRVHTGDEGAVLVALLPGFEPGDIDITISGDTLTLKGSRAAQTPGEESAWHRRERRTGSFARNFTLPFEIEADQVEASFQNGLLEVRMPRVASQKPRKIQIATS